MLQTDARSLQQIKRETEQTRAGLTDTVEQLCSSAPTRRIAKTTYSAEPSRQLWPSKIIRTFEGCSARNKAKTCLNPLLFVELRK
jgi:hypothetical protein